MSYQHDSLEDCIDSGEHLQWCDRDGFCDLCGYSDCPDADYYAFYDDV